MRSKRQRWLLAVWLGLSVAAGCTRTAEERRCGGVQACSLPGVATAGAVSSRPEAMQTTNVLTSTSTSEQGALGVRFQNAQGLAIDAVVLACGECVDVEAVVHGGTPPYSIVWEDGSSQARRRVCADASSSLSVRVSDTPIQTAEFDSPAQTANQNIDVNEVACAKDGMCERGAGPQTPRSGRFEGSGSYVCDNDANAQSAALINHLQLSLELEIDTDAPEQRGRAFFQWGLIVIVGAGELSGSLECGGALRASLQEATWGVPGNEPRSVIPTGTLTAEVTARAAPDPNAITGSWTWTSMTPAGEYGNTCNGTYEAKLVQ